MHGRSMFPEAKSIEKYNGFKNQKKQFLPTTFQESR